MPANPSADPRLLVDEIIREAARLRASDVHFEPVMEGVEVRYRVDGVLRPVRTLDLALGRSAVTRLMVMAQLLTYRLDVPQEGRMVLNMGGPRSAGGGGGEGAGAGGKEIELRVSIMPTTHGLRAAVRMPAELIGPQTLEELNLPPRVMQLLRVFAATDAGMLLVTGPAGSGKTTTIYALLEHIARLSPGVSIIALEDPVERDLPHVTQIEVQPFGELTYERALRSILRQDPQVLMLGEIRDAATASLAISAALSGHRLISTMHAATPGGAIARLYEMGLEPYQVSGALFGVVSQRLLRKCDGKGGYSGRTPLAEMAVVDGRLRAAIGRRADAEELQRVAAAQEGYQTIADVAEELIRRGVTDAAEVGRVPGKGGGEQACAGA